MQSLFARFCQRCDYYSAECHRDVALARQFGLRKPVFAVCPNSGGIDIELTRPPTNTWADVRPARDRGQGIPTFRGPRIDRAPGY